METAEKYRTSFPPQPDGMFRFFEFVLPVGADLRIEASGDQVFVWCDVPEDAKMPPTIFSKPIRARATRGLLIVEEE
jgi:hypothetical protein